MGEGKSRVGFELEEGTFQAIIFDCDGTLVETLPAHVGALQEALAPYGLSVSAEWCRGRSGQTPATVLEAFEREIAALPVAREVVLQRWLESFDRNLHLLEEVSAVSAIAQAWRGRVPMAVASNGRRANVMATLAAVRLLELFDVVVTIEDVGRGKPEPELFLEAARRMGVAPGECLVFEDSPEGIRAAERAGMRYLLVTAGGEVVGRKGGRLGEEQ